MFDVIMLAPNIVNTTEIMQSFVIAVENSLLPYNFWTFVILTGNPCFCINNAGIIASVVTITIITAITIIIIDNFLSIFPLQIL